MLRLHVYDSLRNPGKTRRRPRGALGTAGARPNHSSSTARPSGPEALRVHSRAHACASFRATSSQSTHAHARAPGEQKPHPLPQAARHTHAETTWGTTLLEPSAAIMNMASCPAPMRTVLLGTEMSEEPYKRNTCLGSPHASLATRVAGAAGLRLAALPRRALALNENAWGPSTKNEPANEPLPLCT